MLKIMNTQRIYVIEEMLICVYFLLIWKILKKGKKLRGTSGFNKYFEIDQVNYNFYQYKPIEEYCE